MNTFPSLENHEKFRAANEAKYSLEEEAPPTTCQEVISRLHALVVETYESGVRNIRTGVGFDPAALTDLPFKVPRRSGIKAMGRYELHVQVLNHLEDLVNRSNLFDFKALNGLVCLRQFSQLRDSWVLEARFDVDTPAEYLGVLPPARSA